MTDPPQHRRPPADPRLDAAIAASRAWYDDVMRLHSVPVTVTDDLWTADDVVPPWHSTVLTMRPGVSADAVAAAARARAQHGLPVGSIADGFADLDLAPHGFAPLFEATWIRVEAIDAEPVGDWRVLAGTDEFRRWSEMHDYVGVLPDRVLAHPRFRVLGRFNGERMTGGAVTHLPTHDHAVVGLSNVWEGPGEEADWPGLLRAVGRLHPRRAVVGYEQKTDLERALASGFASLGTHRVWVSVQ